MSSLNPLIIELWDPKQTSGNFYFPPTLSGIERAMFTQII